LVTNDLADYEQLALTLARDSRLLGELRKKLIRNIRTAPLFDTGRFCTSIETAYLKMYEIFQEGESPRSFSV
jgi:protein O-GlcNAc transferase